MEEDRLLTVVEAAHFLSLAPGSVYHLISQRRIPVVRISARCVRFSRNALLKWLEGMSNPLNRTIRKETQLKEEKNNDSES
jgi:excisionase family DNA binding protein